MSAGNVLAFAGAALIGVAVVAPSLKGGGDGPAAPGMPPPVAGVAAPPPTPGGETAPAAPRTLFRNLDGHFYADARVNGATIHFLVDTGASVVVLSRADAQRAGIQLPAERSVAMGVGGPVPIAPVIVDRIAIGGIEARGVPGAVADELPVSLLGQSYLQRVGSVEIHGDTMVLR